jgi:glycosyltransferase involved in cell wall biosynthesis
MTEPLVSIVVPSYNHAKFISKAIDSVLSQTYQNFEIIIADNCSDDGTDRILASYKDHRIRTFKLKNEGIIAKSRNLAIKEARGEWVAFLDSDDWWFDNKLESCISNANNSTQVIYHDMKVFDGDNDIITNKILKSRKLRNPVLIDLLVNGNCLINSSVMVRREMLTKVGGIDERRGLVTGEDYHCWMKLARESNNFLYLPKELGYYTVHQRGMSRRDVVAQTRLAVNDFSSNLTVKQLNHANAFLSYFSLVNLQENKSKSIENAIFCFKNGKPIIKFKAFVVLSRLLLKKT